MRTIPSAKKWKVGRRAAAIAVIGLAISILVYVNAPEEPDDPFGYAAQNSKTYLLQMEKIGGKANVAAEEFREWLASLWHGRSLGVTLAVLTLMGSFIYWFIALHHVPAPKEPDDGRFP